MKNDFPTIFIQEQLLFFSFSHFNWYLFFISYTPSSASGLSQTIKKSESRRSNIGPQLAY